VALSPCDPCGARRFSRRSDRPGAPENWNQYVRLCEQKWRPLSRNPPGKNLHRAKDYCDSLGARPGPGPRGLDRSARQREPLLLFFRFQL